MCPRSCGARTACSSSATRRPGASTGCSRAAASPAARRSSTPSSGSSPRRSGSSEDLPLEGPVALADSISPPGWPPKHVVHIVFAGYLGDRSLERVTSGDAGRPQPPALRRRGAVRPGSPPADPALPRPLAAGRSDGLSRLALGAVTAQPARHSARPSSARTPKGGRSSAAAGGACPGSRESLPLRDADHPNEGISASSLEQGRLRARFVPSVGCGN